MIKGPTNDRHTKKKLPHEFKEDKRITTTQTKTVQQKNSFCYCDTFRPP